MTNAVENENVGASEKSGTSTVQTVLIGLGILAVAALLAYQIFGCTGCYG
jgi:hypothetical protein